MKGLIADPGDMVGSFDFVSLEPAITTHYTNDPMYRYATFDGIGKAPSFNANGVLLIDDIYFMTASVNPCTRALMRKAFESWGFYVDPIKNKGVADPTGKKGKGFVEQWLDDNEVVKDALKKLARALNKSACLGFGYGMGYRKFHKTVTEMGYDITMAEAKATWLAFWNLFSGVKTFADHQAHIAKNQGYIINDFGYRLTPQPRKAYNAVIQSSASGVLDLLDYNMKILCPEARLKAFIHDEVLYHFNKKHKELVQEKIDICVKHVNDTLNWSINLRIGSSFGPTWWEAK